MTERFNLKNFDTLEPSLIVYVIDGKEYSISKADFEDEEVLNAARCILMMSNNIRNFNVASPEKIVHHTSSLLQYFEEHRTRSSDARNIFDDEDHEEVKNELNHPSSQDYNSASPPPLTSESVASIQQIPIEQSPAAPVIPINIITINPLPNFTDVLPPQHQKISEAEFGAMFEKQYKEFEENQTQPRQQSNSNRTKPKLVPKKYKLASNTNAPSNRKTLNEKLQKKQLTATTIKNYNQVPFDNRVVSYNHQQQYQQSQTYLNNNQQQLVSCTSSFGGGDHFNVQPNHQPSIQPAPTINYHHNQNSIHGNPPYFQNSQYNGRQQSLFYQNSFTNSDDRFIPQNQAPSSFEHVVNRNQQIQSLHQPPPQQQDLFKEQKQQNHHQQPHFKPLIKLEQQHYQQLKAYPSPTHQEYASPHPINNNRNVVENDNINQNWSNQQQQQQHHHHHISNIQEDQRIYPFSSYPNSQPQQSWDHHPSFPSQHRQPIHSSSAIQYQPNINQLMNRNLND